MLSGTSPSGHRLRIAAELNEAGDVRATWLFLTEEGGLAIGRETAVGDGGTLPLLPLPAGALFAVFARYGKPLEEDVAIPDDAPFLACPLRLRAFRYRSFGWVQPLDYLVLDPPGGQALCAPAKLVSAALLRLAEAVITGSA